MQDIADQVSEGIVNAVEMIGDVSLAAASGMVYRDVKVEVDRIVAEDQGVELAFASVVVRPEIRTECLVVVTDVQVVVAWRKGLLRKQILHDAIQRSAITGIIVGGGQGNLRKATLLTIATDDLECVVALPLGAPAFHSYLQKILGAPNSEPENKE